MKFSKMKALTTAGATAIYLGLMNAHVVLAADGGEVKSKLTQAGKTIQGILTGLVALAAALSRSYLGYTAYSHN